MSKARENYRLQTYGEDTSIHYVTEPWMTYVDERFAELRAEEMRAFTEKIAGPGPASPEERIDELERMLYQARNEQREAYENLVTQQKERAGVAIEILRRLVEALPKCTAHPDRPATRAWGRGGERFCDECGATAVTEYPRAVPLREAIAFLAALSRSAL